MIRRFSSRKTDLGRDFLADRLQGAASYDRIAGYFCSSVLEIAGEAMEQIQGQARILCNSGLNAQDVLTAGLAAQNMKQEWCAFEPETVYASDAERARLDKLYNLLSSGKLEIRVLPDEIYGHISGNGLSLAMLLRVDPRKSPRRIDECDYGPPEFLRLVHYPQSLSIAFGLCHSEIIFHSGL